jgi:hypothetical protein
LAAPQVHTLAHSVHMAIARVADMQAHSVHTAIVRVADMRVHSVHTGIARVADKQVHMALEQPVGKIVEGGTPLQLLLLLLLRLRVVPQRNTVLREGSHLYLQLPLRRRQRQRQQHWLFVVTLMLCCLTFCQRRVLKRHQ